ncbi:MAG: aminoacyl-tRNA hydrolase, partial [Janthinobacterium lividum]
LAQIFNFCWSDSLKFHSQMIDGIIANHRVIMIKPSTFMNLSGSAIQSVCAYYKIETQNIIIMHDDIDLPSGSVKFKLGGNAGGHNGLKSVDQFVGRDYYRVRMGVGRPENSQHSVSDFVLAALNSNEYNWLLDLAKIISNNLDLFFFDKHTEFKNQLCQRPA